MSMAVYGEIKKLSPSSDNGGEQAEKTPQSFINAITSLVAILEAKNEYTNGHSERVTNIAVAIANELGMPQPKVEKIRIAGLLHDIGKVGISEMVLNKRGQLTEEEFAHIASHSTIGERILRPIIDDDDIIEIVRHHHEQYDGSGYPDGLEADNIPIGARILAVADAYDAMTSERPHRQAMTTLLTVIELKSHAGTQFDPIIVNAFLKIQSRLAKASQLNQSTVIYS